MELWAGAASNQGKNDYNEDRFVILKQLPEDPSSSFFAIYDGHGGTAASTFCQKHLHENLTSQPSYATNKTLALIDAYKYTDKKFLKKLEDCGSTAVCCLLINDGKTERLYVANAGDSRCVLSSGGKAVALSEDHKPGNPKEKRGF